MNERDAWIDIITKLYTKLHMSDRVMHTATENDKKRDRVIKYFERLDRVHNKVTETHSKAAETELKKAYHNLYCIKKEDIPERRYEEEVRIARERGYGNIKLTDQIKEEMAKQIILDQEESLDKWIDYFLYDEESKSYEMWEKFWVFQGLQKLGKYDKETHQFSKRDKTTTYPFPPVEKEAIFNTLKLMEEYIKDKKSEEAIRNALGSGNFKTLYEYSLEQIMEKGERTHNSNEGKWIKYKQGSDYHLLRDSLQGYYTGWCTAAGENFAKNQLEGGDFYVYYSLDEKGQAKVPRIAIRMEGDYEIAEIRGIADDQNMEPEMLPILHKKLKEFPDKDRYFKKEEDMRRLTEIDNKVHKNIELTKEELKFLYELDGDIQGFGWGKDPRISEIQEGRVFEDDLATIFGDSKVYNGKLNLSWFTSVKSLKLPETVNGSLVLPWLMNAEGLEFPKTVNGNLYLNRLKSAKGLKLPETMNGNLSLKSLTSAEGLELPEIVNGSLNLDSLTSAEGLKLPKTINGDLSLKSLTSAEGLELPEIVNGKLNLNRLTSAEGLKLPETFNGNLSLNSVTSAKGLKLPETFNGNLSLNSVTSAKELKLPKTINGNLVLGVTSAEGLKLPEAMNGGLSLTGLKSAEGLKLPETINGDLDLNKLTSAEGLKLPKTINGDLSLKSLTSAEGLELPKTISDGLVFDNLTSIEGLKLPSDFDIRHLIFLQLRLGQRLKQRIRNNPQQYFRTKEEEELLFNDKEKANGSELESNNHASLTEINAALEEIEKQIDTYQKEQELEQSINQNPDLTLEQNTQAREQLWPDFEKNAGQNSEINGRSK